MFYFNCYFKTKTIEIQRRFTPILMNGRNCNGQYGGIVPPSLQRPLEAPVPKETLIVSLNSQTPCSSFMNPGLGNLDVIIFNALHVVNYNEWNTFSYSLHFLHMVR